MSKLTDKQAQFCREYLVDLNATQASIRAGYSGNTAEKIGSENLRKPEIQAEIERLMSERSERCQVNADNVLQLAHELAVSNVFTVLEAVRTGKTNELPDNAQRTVKSIKHKRIEKEDGFTEEITITMHDKVQPLTLLWRHLGLLKDLAEAIASLQTYGTVTQTENGFSFEYADSKN